MTSTDIALFGASVTQQWTNHKTGEITGYSYILKKNLESLGYSIHIVGAGGAHFNYTGFALAASFISKNTPKMLALEWHSTGIRHFDQKALDSLVNLTQESNILLLIIILPNTNYLDSDCQHVKQAHDAGKEPHVTIADLRNLIPVEKFPIYLRDVVHTNHKGAKLYADNISAQIFSLLKNETNSFPSSSCASSENYTASSFSLFEINKFFLKSLGLTCSSLGCFSPVLIFKCLIGPSSPAELVIISDQNNETIARSPLFDSDCYYNRFTFVEIKLPLFSGIHHFSIAFSGIPDYTILKKPASSIPDLPEEILSIKEILAVNMHIKKIKLCPEI